MQERYKEQHILQTEYRHRHTYVYIYIYINFSVQVTFASLIEGFLIEENLTYFTKCNCVF